jgi:hypothetical protein
MKHYFLAFLLSLTCVNAAAQVRVAVGSVTAAPGGKVVVPVNLSEGQNISAIQFDLSFDSTVLSLSGAGAVLKGDLCRDHDILANPQTGVVRVVLFSGSLSYLKPGAGSVAQVVFDVAATAAPGGTSPVTLTNVKASDALGTSMPTIATNGTLTFGDAPNQPAEGQNELIFPQIVNGAISQSSFYYTVVILINQTQAAVGALVRFTKSDGTPFPLTLVSGQSGSEFNVTVGPGASTYLRTNGSGPLAVGYAQATATGPIGGTIMFGWGTAAGATVTEAGVGAATKQTNFSLPVIYTRNLSSTGVAVANTLDADAQLTVRLKNTTGQTVDTRILNLSAGRHLARFVNEPDLFPSLNALESFLGSLHITAPQGVAVVAVKQTLQEGLITTFPIVVME